jgi:RNA polymerase sigma factor (sigma-70 family)
MSGRKDTQKLFEQEVAEVMDFLYTVAYRMTYNQQDAQDLVQETVMRAYRYFDHFRQGTNFKAWIATVMRNLFINEYRKKMRAPHRVDFEKVKQFIPAQEEKSSQEEILNEKISYALQELPEELRAAVTLFYLEGFSYKEISQIMDIPLGTVMSRLHSARETLKKKLFVSEEK